MKSFRHISPLLAVLLLLATGPARAQNFDEDSLKRVTFYSKQDTAKARAFCELAIIYRDNGEQDSARRSGEQALGLARRSGYRKVEANALYQLGILAANRAEYVEAMENFSGAGAIFQATGDKKGYASVLSAMGGQKTLTGDLPGALDYYHQSLKIKEALGDSSVLASTLSNIGITYNALGDQQQAMIYYQRALRLNLKYGKLRHVVTNYYNMGSAYTSMHQDSLALIYAERSARMSDSLGFTEELLYAYGLMAKLEVDCGHLPEAIGYLTKTIALAEKLDDQRMLAYQYMMLGEVYEKIGDREKAKRFFIRSYEIGKSIGSMEIVKLLSMELSEFYEAQGDAVKALAYYKEHIAARDSINSSEKKQEMLRKEMNFEFDKKQALEKAATREKEALRQADQQKKDAITENDRKRKMIIIYAGSAVLLLVLFFLFLSQRQKAVIATQKVEVERQRDRVEEQKNIIVEKNKNITDSINYAQRIQQAILPDPATFRELLPDSFVLYRPKDIVSGDFYWVAEQNSVVYYATADCTGHGVPGGFMSVLGASLLNEVINEKKLTQPAEILDMMRVKIINALRQKGETGENKDGMDMVLCRIDLKKRELIFSAANNPVWLVQNGELRKFSPDKQPVGIGVENPSPFAQHVVQLAPGDLVYTFTDGYADQFGGPKGKKFKYSQLGEKITAMSSLPLQQQKDALEKILLEWKGDLEQVDDVLLIGVRV